MSGLPSLHRTTPGSTSTAQPNNPRNQLGQKLIDWLLVLLVTLMPFHAFLSVWLGSQLGHQTLIQSWKEVVLVILALLVIGTHKLPDIIHTLKRPVNLTIIAFAALAIGISVATGAHKDNAFWFGVKTDLGFLMAFILAQFASERIKKVALVSFLAASTAVAAFGLLQVTVLPVDFLKNFGYGPDTILPFRMVDPAVSSVRILSTLGGPNQLGSFMILPICIAAYLGVKKRQPLWLLPIGLFIFNLWHSYSRSAQIGTVAALGFMLLAVLRWRWRIVLLSIAIAASITLALNANRLLTDSRLQFYFLHGRLGQNEVLGSDAGRISNLQNGLKAVEEQPFGRGLGTSGPASYQSESPIITEDYYLQLAIEAGLLGLLLFGLITLFTGIELPRSRHLPGLAMLAALIGLTINNLFLHTWADSSTALTFWTLAGLAIGGAEHDLT